MDDELDDPFLWDVDTLVENLGCFNRPCYKSLDELAQNIREQEIDGHTLLTHELVGQGNAQDLRNELHKALGIRSLRHKNALTEAIMTWRRDSPEFSNWMRENLRDVDSQSSAPSSQLSRSSSELGHGKHLEVRGSDQTTGHSQKPKKKRVAPELLQEKPTYTNLLETPTKADNLSSFQAANHQNEDLKWFTRGSTAKYAYLGGGQISPWAIKYYDGPLSIQIRERAGTLFTASQTRFPTGIRLVVARAVKQLLRRNSRNTSRSASALHFDTKASDVDEILDLDDLASHCDDETLREMEEDLLETQQMAKTTDKLVPEIVVKEILNNAVSEMKALWGLRKLPKLQRKAYRIWKEAFASGDRKERIYKACKLARQYDGRIKKLSSEILQQSWEKERDVKYQAKCLEQTLANKLQQAWIVSVLESRSEPPKPSNTSPTPTPRTARRPQQCLSDEEVLTSSDEEEFMANDEISHPGEHQQHKDCQDTQCVEDLGLGGQLEFTTSDPEPLDYVDLTVLATPEKHETYVEQLDPICIDLISPLKAKSEDEGTGSASASRDRIALPSNKMSTASQAAAVPKTPAPEALTELDAPLSQAPVDYSNAEKIGGYSPQHWSKCQDRFRLTICLLWQLGQARRSKVLQKILANITTECFQDIASKHISECTGNSMDTYEPSADTLLLDMASLFVSYVKGKPYSKRQIMNARSAEMSELHSHDTVFWAGFCSFLQSIAEYFPKDNQIFRTDSFDVESPDDATTIGEGILSPPPGQQEAQNKSSKTSVREIVRDKAAVDIRARQHQRAQELLVRRDRLRAEMRTADSNDIDGSRFIINESKKDDQAFIYVHDAISKRIKDHQVQGVRFLWNQIMQEPEEGQGCLLAHTMGLGKTMQVITFLVAIQETARSPDPSVYGQVPEGLRDSKTLVVCPPGLVTNWIDELYIWDRDELLGGYFFIDSSLQELERSKVAEEWSKCGGVLVIGFSMLVRATETSKMTADILLRAPTIVIADEAHNLKSPTSKAHQTCIRFDTKTRIAMSGSPLANNIEEYYFMIDWVAPNFLGPVQEFRSIYAQPIQQGLWHDSDSNSKRKALKMLQVLKETVATKVHRATTKSLMRNDLPPKTEFVIYLSPTPLQVRLYDLFIQEFAESEGTENDNLHGKIFAIANNLALLCAHPACFVSKLLDGGAQGNTGHNSALPPSLASAVRNETKNWPLDSMALSRKIELLNQILDLAKEKGDKVLVFSQSIPTLNFLENLCMKQGRQISRLDGGTVVRKRQDAVRKFNADAKEVYLISTNAGGVGLNIQGANRVVIFDFKWNPVSEQQAIGRAYRIGQAKPVVVYHFVTAGTFEDDLQNKAVFKMQLASRVVDKKNPICWSKRLGDITHPLIDVRARDLNEFLGKDTILDQLIQGSNQGDKIKYIMSTDTFEEEDQTVDLTVEERKEADTLVSQNRLRLMDARKHDRLKRREVHHGRHGSATALGYDRNDFRAISPSSEHTVQ